MKNKMINKFLLALVLCFSVGGVAEAKIIKRDTGKRSPASAELVNTSAFEILLKNSGRMTTQDGQTVSHVLSTFLGTGGNTTNKISNVCVFSSSDQLFKCQLNILNSDVKGTKTESSIQIKYELEKLPNGRPSEDLFMLSVDLEMAG